MPSHLRQTFLYFNSSLAALAADKVIDFSKKLKEKQEQDELKNVQKDLETVAPIIEEQKELDEISKKREEKFLAEVEKESGVWMHRFSDVRRDDKGFFILKSDNPASNKMRQGDELSDFALNMTPYWKIEKIEGDRINLTPINSNPFKTGIGAGGAKITKHDVDVYTGKYERDRVEKINQALATDNIDVDTVKYILLGTVPVHFGPNGAQGGWYSAEDTGSNRGSRQGLKPRDIMMRDAKTIQEHGIPVPVKALDGTMDPYNWSKWVGGNGTDTTYVPKNLDKYVDFHKSMTDKGKFRYDESSLKDLYHKHSPSHLDAYYDQMFKDIKMLSPEEWKLKYPYVDQNSKSVLQQYEWKQRSQEKIKQEAIEYLTEGETDELDSIMQNVFSRERRVSNRNVAILIEMCKEDPSYVKYLHDIINLGGSPDYLTNEQIIKFFNLIDDVDGLKLCINKLTNSDNLRYALSYLFQQGEEELALNTAGKTNDLEVINAMLTKLAIQYSESSERRDTFGRNQKLLDFIKQNNVVDKLKSIKPDDMVGKHYVGEIVSQVRRSFGPVDLWQPGDEELLNEIKSL